jgi:hypothetical protein
VFEESEGVSVGLCCKFVGSALCTMRRMTGDNHKLTISSVASDPLDTSGMSCYRLEGS